MSTHEAGRRVWSRLPDGTRSALTEGLSPTDLRTALLDVAAARAERVTPAQVLRRRAEDRFVPPSTVDPRALVRVQAALWSALPEHVEGVELSPVAPLGACSALGPIPQNNVLTTIRGTEVAADPTNGLALEAAVRRRAGAESVHLATCQRVVRAQTFEGPGMAAHFQLFALVSSMRDAGSGRTEAAMMVEHLRFWRTALSVLGLQPRLTFTSFRAGAVRERILDTVRPAVAALELDGPPAVEGAEALEEDAERTKSAGYYDGTALGIAANGAELGDGGLTRWTALLLGDAKERCLTSCVSTERLTALLG